MKNCSGKKRKSQKQLVNNNHAKTIHVFSFLSYFMSPFLHFISYLLRLCHLTLINLNEIAPKVNNAVITSKEYRLQEVVIFSPKEMIWQIF